MKWAQGWLGRIGLYVVHSTQYERGELRLSVRPGECLQLRWIQVTDLLIELIFVELR